MHDRIGMLITKYNENWKWHHNLVNLTYYMFLWYHRRLWSRSDESHQFFCRSSAIGSTNQKYNKQSHNSKQTWIDMNQTKLTAILKAILFNFVTRVKKHETNDWLYIRRGMRLFRIFVTSIRRKFQNGISLFSIQKLNPIHQIFKIPSGNNI